MAYMTSIERFAMEETLLEGIAAILEIRFGEAGKRLIPRVHKMQRKEIPDLQGLIQYLKHGPTVTAVEEYFDAVG